MLLNHKLCSVLEILLFLYIYALAERLEDLCRANQYTPCFKLSLLFNFIRHLLHLFGSCVLNQGLPESAQYFIALSGLYLCITANLSFFLHGLNTSFNCLLMRLCTFRLRRL